jgi:hypothetical protein
MSAGGTTSYGNDNIDGGTGVDTVDFIGNLALGAVEVDLAGAFGRSAGSFFFILNVENVVGGGFADRLSGDMFANVLEGQGGNDTLAGGEGNDFFDFRTAPSAANADRILESAGRLRRRRRSLCRGRGVYFRARCRRPGRLRYLDRKSLLRRGRQRERRRAADCYAPRPAEPFGHRYRGDLGTSDTG